MEENQGFFQKYGWYVMGGIILILLVIFVATRDRTSENEDSGNEEITEQSNTNASNQQSPENPATEIAPSSNQPSSGSASQQNGEVSAKGQLLVSDNPAKGNLMMTSDRGKIYISTKRDFSTHIGKEVTLDAQGSLSSFTFRGFKETSGTAPVATPPAQPQTTDTPGSVNVTGRLEQSDNTAKGNYVIHSDAGKVYLQSRQNYSSWIGSEVTLTAKGSLSGFSEAKLQKR